MLRSEVDLGFMLTHGGVEGVCSLRHAFLTFATSIGTIALSQESWDILLATAHITALRILGYDLLICNQV